MALEPARKSRTVRELRSLANEVGHNDPEAFADLIDVYSQLGEMIADAADALRTDAGYSWADLAAPLGVTRSAVQQRWGRRFAADTIPAANE